MKQIIIPSLFLAAASLCHAEATIKSSPGLAGVSYSRIESTALTEAEIKSLRMTATVDVVASVSNVITTVNNPVMVRSSHTVCFSTFLTTEADYVFNIDIGGQQSSASEHIVIPARQRTCVTKELYRSVVFPGKGNYQYTASTMGRTMSSGQKSDSSSAFIFVN